MSLIVSSVNSLLLSVS